MMTNVCHAQFVNDPMNASWQARQVLQRGMMPYL